MDGFLLINKEKGWTSFDICKRISHILDTKKVGHSGTLDPFATGLMIVAVNKATKALLYSNYCFKTYVATLKLGIKTKTGDLTSEEVERKPVPELNKEIVDSVLNSFVGESEQIPPMTSAVHHEGVKLYKLAQQGIEVERKPRKISIKYIKLLGIKENEIIFQCLVSSGTYIRVLGEDIANRLNTVGHLTSLNRIAFGEKEEITLDSAIKVEEVNEDKIQPILNYLDLKKVKVNEDLKKKAVYGQNLKFDDKSDKILLINDNIPIAVYCLNEDGTYHCERGLW